MMRDGELLRRAAERASHHPFYLASSLLAYARAEGLDDEGLAGSLGCDLNTLPALLLCRRPTGRGAVFRADVEAIAARFGLDAGRLARLIRDADVLVSLQGATADRAGGLLAAARDRDGSVPRPVADDDRDPDGVSRPDPESDEGGP
jgi:hypothetical protein